jgi:hypothetical protein
MRATGMHISDTLTQPGYAEALQAFVARHIPARGAGGVVQAYAAVQQMPYFSGPDRTPLAALRDGRGACTAKHIILRDALRAIGQRADVEVVKGDFAAAIPVHASQDMALAQMIGQGGVTDFHCRVVLHGPEGDRRLDATWPVALASYGFAINRGWTGQGDTIQAIPGATVSATPEDVLATKAQLLAGLDPAMIARRLEFLRLLSAWMAGLQMNETSGRA